MARALGFDLVDLVSLRRSLSYLNNKINGIDVATPDTRHGVTLPVLSSFPSPPPPPPGVHRRQLSASDRPRRMMIFFFFFSKLIQSRLNLNLNFDWRLIGDDGVLMANVYMNLDSTHYALPLIFTFYVPFILSEGGRGGRGGGDEEGDSAFWPATKRKKGSGIRPWTGRNRIRRIGGPQIHLVLLCVCVCVGWPRWCLRVGQE